jgi:hypothetical protein
MATEPKEYLPLVNVDADHNFSKYATKGPGTTVLTHFTRVRIDPLTLTVDIDDVTFSESTGMLMHVVVVTSMPYGVAESCDGPGMANGAANIDLVGTPFKVVDSFCTAGSGAAGDAVLGSDDQVDRPVEGREHVRLRPADQEQRLRARARVHRRLAPTKPRREHATSLANSDRFPATRIHLAVPDARIRRARPDPRLGAGGGPDRPGQRRSAGRLDWPEPGRCRGRDAGLWTK